MANIPISSFTAAANATGIGMSGFSLTGANAQSMLDLAGTWNTSGTPTGLKLNVTDTASNAASLLMDLQVGGTARFSVRKDGFVQLNGASASLAASSCGVATQGAGIFSANTDTGSFRIGAANDVILTRDAADILAQRRTTNAQTFRVYNTFTDASNYQRIRISSSEIFTENAGTGAAQSLALAATSAGARLLLNTNGIINFYGASVANIWNFNASGHFVAGADNTYDIGASGANRPRSIFTSAGVVFANSLAVNSSTFHSVLWNAGQYGWASSSTVATNTAIDTGLSRVAAGIVGVTNGSTGGGAMQMTEITAPAAPAADNVRIYAEDNGAGKTRLMARFATGAAVQIAIEP